MKYKRGSHVGIVLSFVMFIIFLVFLYTIIEPTTRTQQGKESLLNHLKAKLIERATKNSTVFTVKINEVINPNKDCVKVQNIIGEIINETDLIIKDEYENTRNYSVSGQALIIHTGKSFGGFLRIYYSGELEPSPPFFGEGCEPITQFSIGLIRVEENIYSIGITSLMEDYNNKYKRLKEELGIPAGNDFGFSFEYSNGTVIETGEIDVAESIYVMEIPIQYLDEEANLESGFISVKIW